MEIVEDGKHPSAWINGIYLIIPLFDHDLFMHRFTFKLTMYIA